MRWFETRGPVDPENNYVVARTEELVDFVDRLKRGRYISTYQSSSRTQHQYQSFGNKYT